HHPTPVPPAAQQAPTLADITAALAAAGTGTGSGSGSGSGDLTGVLAPLWNSLGPALGEVAAANPDLWDRSLRGDPMLWRLPQVRQVARDLIDHAGWLAATTLVDGLSDLATGEEDRYGLAPDTEPTAAHDEQLAALVKAAGELA